MNKRIYRTLVGMEKVDIAFDFLAVGAAIYLIWVVANSVPENVAWHFAYSVGMFLGFLVLSYILVTVVKLAIVDLLIPDLIRIFFKKELEADREEEAAFLKLAMEAVAAMPEDRQQHYFELLNNATEFDHTPYPTVKELWAGIKSKFSRRGE